MEVKIRNRSRVMQFIATLLFLSLVWAYAQLEWGTPQGVSRAAVQARGSIYSADGKVLARSMGDRRVYPQGRVAGQVVGMMGATEGLEGLEYAFDRRLAAGEDITLTIDTGIQAAAEGALAQAVPAHRAEYGSVVVLDTHTGEVLAAASYPPFDPNAWRSYSAGDRRNRPFLDVFEPGSTVKGLVVAAAMNEGLTTPGTVYATPMRRHVGGRWGSTIGDAVPHPPTLTTQGVLRYSSNVGMTHVVEAFTPEKMHGYLSRYGFGSYVSMPDVPSATGSLQPIRRWDDLVRATNAFGQGMSSTALQLAAAYNTMANDGVYVSPRLVEGTPRGPSRRVIQSSTARQTREMLRKVIEEGIPGAAGVKGYAVAGKTGTAQVVVDGKYSSTVYDSVFAGFFPADAPRVTVAVMVHGAKLDYHGSMLAAPIFKSVSTEVLSKWGAAPTVTPPAPAKR